MRKLFILGFPGLYGGASTELHHQLPILSELGRQLNFKLCVIPTHNPKNEPLLEFTRQHAEIEEYGSYSDINKEDAIMAFCSDVFLNDIATINKFTKNTCFINCMTWLFDKEKAAHANNLIKLSLYQRQGVSLDHSQKLRRLGSNARFERFYPFFNPESTNFLLKDSPSFHIGRISRSDADKFSKQTFGIWHGIVSPKPKIGHVLGWRQSLEDKVGPAPQWAKTYTNHTEFPVNEFYNTCDIIVQSTDTKENWPRIGFEAMHSGCPLVVDNRGGWKELIEHKMSGFLCDNERDFIYWGSRLAYEPELRWSIASEAKQRAYELSNKSLSMDSWKKAIEILFN